MNKKRLILFLFVFSPLFVFAEETKDFQYWVAKLMNTINFFWPVLIGGVSLAFLYGVIKFILLGAEEKKRDESKQFMKRSLIGVFIFLSVFALVSLIRSFFELPTSPDTDLPVPTTISNLSN